MIPQELIAEECDRIKDLLLEKNKKYGNSALEPKRIFSKATPIEQILVRIDDKLSRIATTGLAASDEDTLQDLIGYLILLRVARKAGEALKIPADVTWQLCRKTTNMFGEQTGSCILEVGHTERSCTDGRFLWCVPEIPGKATEPLNMLTHIPCTDVDCRTCNPR